MISLFEEQTRCQQSAVCGLQLVEQIDDAFCIAKKCLGLNERKKRFVRAGSPARCRSSFRQNIKGPSVFKTA
ncbi:hypothetical protein ASG25_07500 [Rhizobium sp. Leaf384]|nr:hypothetical protein [Rhizobium sp. Leaf384]KQS81307.1 hypothetical protein ASG25_07500 [Rhizobium sp. Leaf384]KQS87215.1 hypothetical protein ASG58_03060 [Rhizobium sp. Leaf383]